jgi:hypothetical protein
MNKADLLNKSQIENMDETIDLAEKRGKLYGITLCGLIFIGIGGYELFFGSNMRGFYVASSMFWAYYAADSLAKFRFLKKKAYLIITVCGMISSVLSIVCYFKTQI